MTYNSPDYNTESKAIDTKRRERKGLFIIFGVLALAVILAIGYAAINSPADIEPAAGVGMIGTAMDNDNADSTTLDGATGGTTAPQRAPGGTY